MIWETVNLVTRHNATCTEPTLRFDERCTESPGSGGDEPAFTASYTSMKETGDSEVMICCDRLGNGWDGAPGPWGPRDSVFVVRVQADGRDR